MSLTLTIPFDTPANYTYDSNKIEVSGGLAQLILENNTGQTFNQDFANDTGFTYDSAKAEFSGGQVQQIDQRPANSTCHATYTNDINLNWGNGTLTGTASGGASVSSGKLDLSFNDVRYVDYNADLNADSQQVGCIRFKITPNYSGSPGTNMMFLGILETDSSVNNIIQIRHNSDGNIRTQMFDSTGGSVNNSDLGIWVPTSGQEYEIELNYDITTGATRLFIDGTQFGITQTGTGTRSVNISLLRAGSNYLHTSISNFKIDDLMIFSTVQHTSNYTPSSYATEYVYDNSTITLPQFSYSGVGVLQAFTAFATTQSGNPRYIINDQYWNGSAWVSSDGSYTQANTVTQVSTNISSFTATDNITIKIRFDDSNTVQSSVDDLTLTYTGQIYPIDNPTIKIATTTKMDGLDGFSATDNVSGSDAVKYTIEVDGVEKYWDGGTWSNSSGYAQSNTAAEIEANKTSLDLSAGANIRIVSYLHSNDGSTYPELLEIVVQYDFYAGTPTTPNTCIVYGWVYDANGVAESNISVSARLKQDTVYNDETLLSRDPITTTTNINGYWDLTLIELENATPDTAVYEFIFSNGNLSRTLDRIVPNEVTKKFEELEGL